MTDQELTKLKNTDSDGLLTYEFIANNIGECDEQLPELAQILVEVDRSGQFTASASRFLNAINADAYADTVRTLVAATIDRDRERRYLPELMESLYGADFESRSAELSATDNNFRRMYKRLYGDTAM